MHETRKSTRFRSAIGTSVTVYTPRGKTSAVMWDINQSGGMALHFSRESTFPTFPLRVLLDEWTVLRHLQREGEISIRVLPVAMRVVPAQTLRNEPPRTEFFVGAAPISERGETQSAPRRVIDRVVAPPCVASILVNDISYGSTVKDITAGRGLSLILQGSTLDTLNVSDAFSPSLHLSAGSWKGRVDVARLAPRRDLSAVVMGIVSGAAALAAQRMSISDEPPQAAKSAKDEETDELFEFLLDYQRTRANA